MKAFSRTTREADREIVHRLCENIIPKRHVLYMSLLSLGCSYPLKSLVSIFFLPISSCETLDKISGNTDFVD